MSENCVAGEEETKKEDDETDTDRIDRSVQEDRNVSNVQASDEQVLDVNRDNLKGGEHLLQLQGSNPSCTITEEAKEELQHSSSQKQLSNSFSLPGPAKESESGLDNSKTSSQNNPSESSSAVAGGKTENFTETYDVITRKEVQDLTDWESIHKESLSEIPPIDPGAIHDLESRAKDVAHNLDHLLGTLAACLKSMSVIGVQSIETYRATLGNVEETVDSSIKSMYTLIAKCEELNSHIGPLYTIAAQIKEIKSTLDVFESMCK